MRLDLYVVIRQYTFLIYNLNNCRQLSNLLGHLADSN